MSDLEYLGKAKGFMTMKEHEQARLLKDKVLPASELVKRKQEEVERAFSYIDWFFMDIDGAFFTEKGHITLKLKLKDEVIFNIFLVSSYKSYKINQK